LARKILLADDSVTAQNMGRKILTDAGYEVITVNNGSAALKKIAEHKPDLIVLDVYMPGYSGLEVCQRIKEKAETARIPVLLTVGKLEPFKPEEARRARADAFVVKPFEASELLAALTKLEDKVIPQPEPYKQGRFAKAVASFERDTEPAKGEDDSWKARLRIPTAPKPRETAPDPDYSATQGKGFRDLADSPAKKNQALDATKEVQLERPLPAGIPHDITPDEIAAIAAAAARLNGATEAVPTSVTEAPAEERLAKEKIEPATEPGSGVSSVTAEEAAPMTFASAPEVPHNENASPSVTAEVEGEPVTSAIASEEAVPAAEAVAEMPSVQAGVEESGAATALENASSVTVELATGDTPEAEKLENLEPAKVKGTETAPETEAVAPWPGAPSDVPMPPAAEPIPVSADDEVMAALQTLIPTSSPEPTNDLSRSEVSGSVLVAVTGNADTPITGAHRAGPRWVAEEVQTALDEAASSLEQEMEKAYAAVTPQEGPLATVAIATDQVEVSADESSETGSTSPQPGDHGMAYAMASAAAAGIGPALNENSSVHNAMPESGDATIVIPVIEGSVPAVETAKDGIATGEAEAVDESSSESEIVGGIEAMSANWKNIRDSIAGAAAKPAPAKEEFHEAEAAKVEPEVTAAPVSEKVGSAPVATDPKAIASIVDSVLAELRPRIVEEIARKLADSKKD
jgi:CheY-like chemotaxis protein